MECYYRSEPKKRGFRKSLYAIWQEKGLYEASEQQVAGQALCIRKNQWLSKLELEEIKRKIDETNARDDPELGGDDGRAIDWFHNLCMLLRTDLSLIQRLVA